MNKHSNANSKSNYFGSQLEELMIFTGVKNTLIASALNYDTSYISKWITGKSLPSKKNIEKILSTLCDVFISYPSEDIRADLLARFNARNTVELKDSICSYLRNSYYDTIGEMNDHLYMNNAALNITPQVLFPLLKDYAKSLFGNNNLNISVMADLFSLESTTKLLLAGITNQRFTLTRPRQDLKIDYIIDISSLRGTSVYDMLLLIHMTTCFSLSDFELYHRSSARGKLLLAVDEEFSGISLLDDHQQFLCTTSTRDSKTSQKLYQTLQTYAEPDKKIFFKTDMNNLLLSHQYIQALISQNTRWLVGHITEQFISPELFGKLSKKYFEGELIEEVKRAYLLNVNAVRTGQVQIMIYGLALMQFALSGELDFFNQKIILSPEELRHEFNYIHHLFQQIDGNRLRLINEGFSDDFNYITNPHLCLSSSIGYLRLENKHYMNNLLLIHDEYLQKAFDSFFETIWHYDSSIVISDKDTIIQRINTLMRAAEIFSNS